jgi:hypothetical protein
MHEFYIYFTATGNNLPTTTEQIKRVMFGARQFVGNTGNNTDVTLPALTYDANGVMSYHHGAYFELHLQNTITNNRSRNDFVKLFITITHHTGAQLNWLANEYFEATTGIRLRDDAGGVNSALSANMNSINDAKFMNSAIIVANIAAAPDITKATADRICADITIKNEISSEQKYAYDRWRLRQTYRWTGAIDEKFVAIYNDKQLKTVYKNLSTLLGIVSSDITKENIIAIMHTNLEHIRVQEQQAHQYYITNGTHIETIGFDDDNGYNINRNHRNYKQFQHRGLHQDITRTYTYTIHANTIRLLRLFQFTSPYDPQIQHKLILEGVVKQNYALMWHLVKSLCDQLQIRFPRVSNVLMIVLKITNLIFSTVYGFTIISTRNEPNLYRISTCAYFELSANESARLQKPLIGVPKLVFNVDNVDVSDLASHVDVCDPASRALGVGAADTVNIVNTSVLTNKDIESLLMMLEM